MVVKDIDLVNPGLIRSTGNPKKDEYFVKIEWLETRDESEAFWVSGLSSNQNSVFRLTNQFTIDTLTKHFGLNDDEKVVD